jgi:hypothetical protein
MRAGLFLSNPVIVSDRSQSCDGSHSKGHRHKQGPFVEVSEAPPALRIAVSALLPSATAELRSQAA